MMKKIYLFVLLSIIATTSALGQQFSTGITLTSPNGGEIWSENTTHNITWTSETTPGPFVISYTKGDGYWYIISDAVSGDARSFTWQIPIDLGGENCKIRINDRGTGNMDESDNGFTILAEYPLKVFTPNGGEILYKNSVKSIYWTTTSIQHTFDISLAMDGEEPIPLGSVTGNNGYTWVVSDVSGSTEASTYKIFVTDRSTGVTDASDESFFIKTYVKILDPVGGEVFVKGTTHTIKWQYDGTPGLSDIFLYTDIAHPVIPLAWNVASDVRQVEWTVPSDIEAQDNYKIYIVEQSTSKWATTKEFSIVDKKTTVLSPNGGEILVGGRSYPVKWNSNYQGYINISYQKGRVLIPIASHVPTQQGFLEWQVPNESLSDVKINIFDSSNNKLLDESDNTFSIVEFKAPVLTNPNGGEKLVSGAPYTIKWNSHYDRATFAIYYSLNKGITWSQIASGLNGNLREYVWQIPSNIQTLGNQGAIKITDEFMDLSDISDNNFSIVPKQCTVVAPNGGEKLVIGEPYTVRWNANYTGPVNIGYTLDGSSWSPIAYNVPVESGQLSWTPNFTTTKCKIQIMDYYRGLMDESDNIFSIVPQQCTVITPNGGEELIKGQSYTVKWNANYTGSVNIGYTLDGSGWSPIAYNVSVGLGELSWTPDFTTANCKIQIMDYYRGLMDESDNYFSIKPLFVITSPVGGDMWGERLPVAIGWQDQGYVTGTTYNVDLYKGDIDPVTHNPIWLPVKTNFVGTSFSYISPSEPCEYYFEGTQIRVTRNSNNPLLNGQKIVSDYFVVADGPDRDCDLLTSTNTSDLLLYPNPTNSQLTLQAPQFVNGEKVKVQVYALNVPDYKVMIPTVLEVREGKIVVDVSTLKTGQYSLVVTAKQVTIKKQFIKE